MALCSSGCSGRWRPSTTTAPCLSAAAASGSSSPSCSSAPTGSCPRSSSSIPVERATADGPPAAAEPHRGLAAQAGSPRPGPRDDPALRLRAADERAPARPRRLPQPLRRGRRPGPARRPATRTRATHRPGRRALAGAPLSDAVPASPGTEVSTLIQGLPEERIAAVELLLESLAAGGRHERVLAASSSHLHPDPWNERLHAPSHPGARAPPGAGGGQRHLPPGPSPVPRRARVEPGRALRPQHPDPRRPLRRATPPAAARPDRAPRELPAMTWTLVGHGAHSLGLGPGGSSPGRLAGDAPAVQPRPPTRRPRRRRRGGQDGPRRGRRPPARRRVPRRDPARLARGRPIGRRRRPRGPRPFPPGPRRGPP